MKRKSFVVSIGPRWAAFALSRDGMQMLGTVQRGMQIGALAQLADGRYAQVNGDIIEPLNTSRVLFALRSAHGRSQIAPVPPTPAVVTVKKRRGAVLPVAA